VTRDQAALLAVCVLCVLYVALLVALLVALARARRGVARRSPVPAEVPAEELAEELAALRRRLDHLEHGDPPGAGAGTQPSVEFVITDLGREQPPADLVRPDAPAFADIVVKETVVRAASLAHGLRRGLAPATRNRIRFEMKQELRRARKQRRADLKAAQRDLRARQRRSLARQDREAS
jgi:hypothetical protein